MRVTTGKGWRQRVIPSSADREGDWIQTFMGVAFYPFDPRPEEILIEDIAHALANQCRFSGHVRRFYSVAEHSVHVSRICDPKDALYGLLHDASEAYMQDMARPIKHLPQMAEYRKIEDALQSAIFERFGLEPAMPVSVKSADNRMLAVEARDLMSPLRAGWEKWLDALRGDEPSVTVPLSPDGAQSLFMLRFSELTGGES